MTVRTINTDIWLDPDVEDLSNDALLLLLMAFTYPSTQSSGVLKISDRQLARRFRIDELPKLFEELETVNVVRTNGYIWVKNFVKYQGYNPTGDSNPNFRLAVARSLEAVSDKKLVAQILKYNEEKLGIYIPYQINGGVDNPEPAEQVKPVESALPEWYATLQKFKPFKFRQAYIDDIEKKYAELDLLEAAKGYVEYWSARRKQIRSVEASFRNNCASHLEAGRFKKKEQEQVHSLDDERAWLAR